MAIDLLASSAFAADAAVARLGAMRDALTVTLPLGHGDVRNQQELMSGSVSMDSASVHGDGSLRTAIAAAEDMVLTITF
jgi:hypothetical protein